MMPSPPPDSVAYRYPSYPTCLPRLGEREPPRRRCALGPSALMISAVHRAEFQEDPVERACEKAGACVLYLLYTRDQRLVPQETVLPRSCAVHSTLRSCPNRNRGTVRRYPPCFFFRFCIMRSLSLGGASQSALARSAITSYTYCSGERVRRRTRQMQEPSTRLIIKNVPKHVDEKRLRQHFAERGEVSFVAKYFK